MPVSLPLDSQGVTCGTPAAPPDVNTLAGRRRLWRRLQSICNALSHFLSAPVARNLATFAKAVVGSLYVVTSPPSPSSLAVWL